MSNPNRIALVGPPGSGKTTIANAFAVDRFGYRLSFADGVRREVVDAIRAIDGDEGADAAFWQMRDPATKDEWRALLQAWGTDFRRARDPQYWVRVLDDRIAMYGTGMPLAVDDCRFPNEYDMLRAHDFTFVQLMPGHTTRHMGAQAGHLSEQHWPDFEVDLVLPFTEGPDAQAAAIVQALGS